MKIRNLLFEFVGIDHDDFVSHELRTVNEGLGMVSPNPLFEFLVVLSADTVPELRLTRVHDVDRRHLKVFSVPGKHCSEASDVKVGGVDSGKRLVVQDIVEHRRHHVGVPGTA